MNGFADTLATKRAPVVRPQSQAEWTGRLKHQLTLNDEGDAEARREQRGVTVWAAAVGLQRAIITWRWMRSQNIVMLEDPLAIATNVQFMNDCGMPVSDSKRILLLNEIVHELDWQARVSTPHRARPPVDPKHRPTYPTPRRHAAAAHA